MKLMVMSIMKRETTTSANLNLKRLLKMDLKFEAAVITLNVLKNIGDA